MSEDKTINVLAIPLIKYPNPLQAIDPEDLEALEAVMVVMDKMIGAIAAHKDCGEHECGVYDENLIERCLTVRSIADDLAEAVRVYRDVPRGDEDLTNEERAVKMGEDSIRQVGKRLGVASDEVEKTITQLNLATQIAEAKAKHDHQSSGMVPPAAFVPRHSGKMDA